MNELYIIISSQDYDYANHKMLWQELASSSNKRVIVIDIPADYIVTVLSNHKYRYNESKSGYRNISKNLKVIRPLLFVRPEILPDFFFGFVAAQFWRTIKKIEPDYSNYIINMIVYDARWVKILKGTHKKMRIAYYLFDEVRLNGKDGSVNNSRFRFDEFACIKSDLIFTMTNKLAKSRFHYNSNIVVLGNGAIKEESIKQSEIKLSKSMAFVGNFRNWIDEDLLTKLIKLRPDILFVFAGPVQPDMKEFLIKLLNHNYNTMYYGISPKNNMTKLYKMFDGVIIPYKQNNFIKATRPIKIIEAVLAGTPVVSIPVDGYKENEFIRFATTPETFGQQIDYILTHSICQDTDVYKAFVEENTWESKSKIIDYEFSKLRYI